MQSYKASDFLDAGSLSRSRSTSFSSDSQLPRVNLMSPPSVRPPPAFISSSAASEIITSDQEFNTADFGSEEDATGAGANALVTPDALTLLNAFLDDLLFTILATSKSTQLASIRPAIADVLKPRLASEVVATADEELYEYMGGTEDEQADYQSADDADKEFDLIHAWKLTRLRCMVYTRLGDLEEEDEDEFIALERLRESNGVPRRFATRSRLSSKLNDRARGASDGDANADARTSIEADHNRKRIERLVVEDLDMEKLALNATLGRLWRTWRKRRRNTTLSRTRTVSRESFGRRGQTPTLSGSQKSSAFTADESTSPREPPARELEISAPVDPTTVPLPVDDGDVYEIEVPGFSSEVEGEVQTMRAVLAHKVRPRSLMVISSPSLVPRSLGSMDSPKSAGAIDNMRLRQIRCKSLPNAPAPPQPQPQPAEHDETPSDQPSPRTLEEKKWLETMYEDDESVEFVDATEVPPGTAITTSHEGALEQVNMPLVANDRMSVLEEEEEESHNPSAGRVSNDCDDQIAASLRSLEGKDRATDHGARLLATSLENGSTEQMEVTDGTIEHRELASKVHQPRQVSRTGTPSTNATPIIAETSEGEMHITIDQAVDTQGAQASSGATIEAIDSHRGAQNSAHERRHLYVISSDSIDVPPDDATAWHQSRDLIQEQSSGASRHESYSRDSVIDELPIVHENSRPASVADSERSQLSGRHQASSLVGTSSARTSPQLEQRAAVQRMPRSTPSITTSVKSSSSRSDSVSRVASNSPTSHVSSKLKGLMIRPQGDSSSLRLRSSSETSRASGSAGSLENDASDLDKLINSDETIHFTLTPRSVREMTFPEPSRHVPRSSTSKTADLADVIRTTGPTQDDSRPRTSVSSRNAYETNSSESSKALDSPKHIPIASRMAVPPKSPAREIARTASSPTVVTDFAVPQSAGHSPSARARQPLSSVRPPSGFSNKTNNTTRSNPNRPRLQARPAETGGSQTSDLIDFIREGPPLPGAHRIPRTVAPFRNTIDSDDLHFDHSQEKDRGSSFASTQDDSTPNKSLTSLGSRTGLLESNNRANDQTKDTPSSFAMQDDDRPVPVRKQKRIPGQAPDPYAIDDDDDDEYLEELLNEKPPKRQEESLLDFLRSEPPPDYSSPQPQPLNDGVLPSKGSGMGMRSRLMRGSPAGERAPSSKMSISSLRSQMSLGSQQGQSSNYSYKVGMARNPGVVTSPTSRQTDTSALADFFRNTGPPEPPAGRDMPAKEKETGISRFFARRKKVEA
ncbi:hypothetical protein POX_a01642 [Penicillium oxalicum]|uniref:hypothetical protein n=1 Tax=Penicillium oxalicum TaxID=69781 RepID=UPI0020B743FE|nr:hypothetical protein POX_a01642 [Penicillium oxalicum]KAI2795039.1 hypothetical protein POX_a01642 [Penicillium oxalicum]